MLRGVLWGVLWGVHEAWRLAVSRGKPTAYLGRDRDVPGMFWGPQDGWHSHTTAGSEVLYAASETHAHNRPLPRWSFSERQSEMTPDEQTFRPVFQELHSLMKAGPVLRNKRRASQMHPDGIRTNTAPIYILIATSTITAAFSVFAVADSAENKTEFMRNFAGRRTLDCWTKMPGKLTSDVSGVAFGE